MPKKSNKTLSPEEIAEREKKNWKAVSVTPVDAAPVAMPDAVTPELEQLKERYGVAAQNKVTARKGKRGVEKKTNDESMVIMEPREATDTHVGRKTVLIKDGKIIGEQG